MAMMIDQQRRPGGSGRVEGGTGNEPPTRYQLQVRDFCLLLHLNGAVFNKTTDYNR